MASRWLTAHAVEMAFVAVVAGWLAYVLHLAHGRYSFWSDDLSVIRQGESWKHVLRPYNGALSATSLVLDRLAAEVGHLSFTPFILAGVSSLALVSVSYFFTTKRQFGAWLAAMLAMPLLWFHGTTLRPANLNHLLALVGGIVCAAALNRGRRADAVLAAGLAFSLLSAGGGLVVAGACLVHNVLVRPPVRRWLAVLVPLAFYAVWYVVVNPSARKPDAPGAAQAARLVRDLVLAPFYQVGFHRTPLAVLLMIAFLVWGAWQLRGGLADGANFISWTVALDRLGRRTRSESRLDCERRALPLRLRGPRLRVVGGRSAPPDPLAGGDVGEPQRLGARGGGHRGRLRRPPRPRRPARSAERCPQVRGARAQGARHDARAQPRPRCHP